MVAERSLMIRNCGSTLIQTIPHYVLLAVSDSELFNALEQLLLKSIDSPDIRREGESRTKAAVIVQQNALLCSTLLVRMCLDFDPSWTVKRQCPKQITTLLDALVQRCIRSDLA